MNDIAMFILKIDVFYNKLFKIFIYIIILGIIVLKSFS
jgi:hypothetical protein